MIRLRQVASARHVRALLLLSLGLGLEGCQTLTGSIAGGECKIFEAPKYAVRGLRSYDQDWVDGNIEAGVGGCGWNRPAVRPAALDAVPGQKKIIAPIKKRGLIKRIKQRVWPKATAPVTPTPDPPVIAEPAAPPPPVIAQPPAPRDPVDELLQPSR